MFHKIKSVNVLVNYKLRIKFLDGTTKIYDVKSLFNKYKYFNKLKEDIDLFNNVYVDKDGYALVWNDDIDISCEELWNNGEEVIPHFD